MLIQVRQTVKLEQLDVQNEEYFYRDIARAMVEGMPIEELHKLILFNKEKINDNEVDYIGIINQR